MPREVQQDVIFVFLQLRVAQHINKNLELQLVLLMEGEVQDDDKMWLEEQKMRGELSV